MRIRKEPHGVAMTMIVSGRTRAPVSSAAPPTAPVKNDLSAAFPADHKVAGQVRSAAAATAATPATATATGGRAGPWGARPSCHGDRGQQLDGVVMTVWADRGITGSGHWTGELKGGSAGTAAEVISRHDTQVTQIIQTKVIEA